jgi:hypothetical protein
MRSRCASTDHGAAAYLANLDRAADQIESSVQPGPSATSASD